MKKFLFVIRFILEPLFSIVILPAALILKLYRYLGSARLPLTTTMLKKLGVFVIRNHYYEPMFTFNHDLNRRDRPPANSFGFDLHAQKNFLKSLDYAEELKDLGLYEKPASDSDFYIPNHSFDAGDAEFLYSFLRYQCPNKVIEIGSGHSSKLVARALEKNKSISGKQAEYLMIEPYPKPWLKQLKNAQLTCSKIEDLNLDWSTELQSGDFLFIDSSHMVRSGGDVLVEYLEILPKLQTGVVIHIHDVFTPRDYLARWQEKDVLFWNEQYMVEAILANSDRYTVLAGLNYLKHECLEELKTICPFLDELDEPGSLYIKVN